VKKVRRGVPESQRHVIELRVQYESNIQTPLASCHVMRPFAKEAEEFRQPKERLMAVGASCTIRFGVPMGGFAMPHWIGQVGLVLALIFCGAFLAGAWWLGVLLLIPLFALVVLENRYERRMRSES
jgi:hypothetical protein